MRIRCWLIGCREDDMAPCCYGCGAHIYEEFIERGRLFWVDMAYWTCRDWFRSWIIGNRCEVCGKRLPRGRNWLCDNSSCAESWIPF